MQALVKSLGYVLLKNDIRLKSDGVGMWYLSGAFPMLLMHKKSIILKARSLGATQCLRTIR